MKCFICGATLTKQAVCLKCGTDVRLYKKILATSDHLYNEALYKAKEHDLTGAKNYLRQSLQLNKQNVPARNLLGLIYYELGEPAYAVREWVLSQNYKEEDNIATRYLEDVEKEMHAITISVKKYNQALEYAREGHLDLAVIALKQLVKRPYRIIKAEQLLALIYMEEGSFQKAHRLLSGCQSLDAGDMLTRRYEEVLKDRKIVSKNGSYREAVANILESGGEDGVIIPEHTHESNSYFMNVLYIILGIVLGAGLLYYAVVPSVKSTLQRENADSLVTYEDTISGLNAEITSADAERERLEAQILELNEKVNSGEISQTGIDYDVFLPVLTAYINNDVASIIEADSELDPDVDDKLYQNIYKRLMVDYEDNMGYRAFYRGTEYMDKGAYRDSLDQFKLSYQLMGESARIIYYIGFAYENLGDPDTAMYFYEYAIETYPDDAWVGHSQSRKDALLTIYPDMNVPKVTVGELKIEGLPDVWKPDGTVDRSDLETEESTEDTKSAEETESASETESAEETENSEQSEGVDESASSEAAGQESSSENVESQENTESQPEAEEQ